MAEGNGGTISLIAGDGSGDLWAATPREKRVLCHVAFGLSNYEIGSSLRISVETVKEYVENLLRKLAMNDTMQAALWAIKPAIN